MNENLFNVKIIVVNSTTEYTIRPHLRTSKYLYSQKNDMLGSRLIACSKLAPTIARQM